MPITIDTGTLVPLGLVIAVFGGVWYLAGRMKALSNVEIYIADTKRGAQEVLRRADFEKHTAEDAVFHVSIEKRMTDLERGQTRMDEKLGNIERTLIIIQSDLKKVLEK